MIEVNNRGRLANQMFQLAFAHAAALKLGTKFYFDNILLLSKYFTLEGIGKQLVSPFKKKWITRFKPLVNTEVNNLESPEIVVAAIQDGKSFSGFFQSEKYFLGFNKNIKKLFSIRNEIQKEFNTKYVDVISEEYICVAIRLTDYKDWVIGDGMDVSPLLPFEYFDKLINEVTKQYRGMKLVFISDDIKSVKERFVSEYPEAFYNERCSDMIEDFLLLKHAKVAVISNSSFYWWACWLNCIEHKIIYAPKDWLAFRKNIEYPNSIIAEGWKKIPVCV